MRDKIKRVLELSDEIKKLKEEQDKLKAEIFEEMEKSYVRSEANTYMVKTVEGTAELSTSTSIKFLASTAMREILGITFDEMFPTKQPEPTIGSKWKYIIETVLSWNGYDNIPTLAHLREDVKQYLDNDITKKLKGLNYEKDLELLTSNWCNDDKKATTKYAQAFRDRYALDFLMQVAELNKVDLKDLYTTIKNSFIVEESMKLKVE